MCALDIRRNLVIGTNKRYRQVGRQVGLERSFSGYLHWQVDSNKEGL